MPSSTSFYPIDSLSNDSFYSDSTFQSFKNSILDISVPDGSAFLNESRLDFSKHKKWSPELSGYLSAGYEHGLLTGYLDPESTDPLKVFNTRGDLSAEAFKLPFRMSYNYSTFRNPLGVNNYFRVSLDTERLKQIAHDRKSKALGGFDRAMDRLESGKESISQKLGMGEVLMQKYKGEIKAQQDKMNSLSSQIKGGIEHLESIEQNDGISEASSSVEEGIKDSLQAQYNLSEKRYGEAVALYDTISKLYDKALAIYQMYTELQEQIESKKTLVDGYKMKYDPSKLNDQVGDKKESFLQSIQTFDLGLTYPNTSALSKNSIPVKGINFEMQRKKWYAAICSGVTMNNLMISTDVVQNKLNNTQNLFNQFDFQNIQDRGLLTTLKTGYGLPEETHYFLGLRYLSNSIDALTDTPDSSRVPSLAMELDVKLVPSFINGLEVDVVYGKSSSHSAIIDSTRSNVVNSLFSSDRTNTGLFRVTQTLKTINTELQATLRWIDPAADTRNLGVLQPDNVRYEFRSRSSLPLGMQLSLNYRQDRNNLDNISDTTLVLNVVGGQLNGKITSKVNYFGSVNYLTQDLNSNEGTVQTVNYMYGAGLSAEYKLGKIPNALTLAYNDYLISDSISTGLFRNTSFQNATKFRVGINTFSVNYFRMDDPQLPQNSSLVIGNQFSFQTKKIRMTLGLKYLFSEEYGNDLGGRLKIDYLITSKINLVLEGRKLILGDFYNFYSRERFDRFPYAILTQIKYTLN